MKKITVENPATNEVAYEIDAMSAEEIRAATERAAETQARWKRAPVKERVELVERFIKELTGDRERIAEEMTRQMGKPLWQSDKEINGCVERAAYMASIAEDALKDRRVQAADGEFMKIALEPKGVVLDIASWNYPLMVAVSAVAPAVLAGNAVLLKHSSHTPLCGIAFEEMFRRAGAPDGLVTAITAGRAEADALFELPQIEAVFFTGSVEAGYKVNSRASGLIADVGLELGGKDPAYVREDADLDAIVPTLADAAFYNTGQSCCAVERIYVHSSLFDRFMELFLAEVENYTVGDPMQEQTYTGPMTQKKQVGVLERQVEDAAAKGASVLMGGGRTSVNGRGNYFEPTVITGVNHDMLVMTEESFGPIIGIMPVGGDDEAVALMNDSRYGLTASVWTRDFDAAMALGPRIETGTVYMNRADAVAPPLAWTGVKDSGKGCTLSELGFIHMTQPKSYNFKLG